MKYVLALKAAFYLQLYFSNVYFSNVAVYSMNTIRTNKIISEYIPNVDYASMTPKTSLFEKIKHMDVKPTVWVP